MRSYALALSGTWCSLLLAETQWGVFVSCSICGQCSIGVCCIRHYTVHRGIRWVWHMIRSGVPRTTPEYSYGCPSSCYTLAESVWCCQHDDERTTRNIITAMYVSAVRRRVLAHVMYNCNAVLTECDNRIQITGFYCIMSGSGMRKNCFWYVYYAVQFPEWLFTSVEASTALSQRHGHISSVKGQPCTQTARPSKAQPTGRRCAKSRRNCEKSGRRRQRGEKGLMWEFINMCIQINCFWRSWCHQDPLDRKKSHDIRYDLSNWAGSWLWILARPTVMLILEASLTSRPQYNDINDMF